ncbi:hypothetical protein HK102_002343 [Quaeritorhiza haematococci]|nr:hypothetical protein HK102_002343 [Quaeritorhiza haematococci]
MFRNTNPFVLISKKAILNGTKAIRGGMWEWKGVVLDTPQEVSVQFGLSPASVPEKLRELWPHNFALLYTVSLGSNQLRTRLTVQNTGSAPFQFTTLLHTYLAVTEVSNVAVLGLQSTQFVDKVASSARAVESRDRITISSEVDRVYEAVGTGILKGSDLIEIT